MMILVHSRPDRYPEFRDHGVHNDQMLFVVREPGAAIMGLLALAFSTSAGYDLGNVSHGLDKVDLEVSEIRNWFRRSTCSSRLNASQSTL